MCACKTITECVDGAPALRGQPARAEHPQRTKASQNKPPSPQLEGRRGWRCNDHLADVLRSSQLPQPICC